jgi:hypothetical protein
MADGLLAIAEADLSDGFFDGQSIPPQEPAKSLDDPPANPPAPGWRSKGLLTYASCGIFEPQVKVPKTRSILFHAPATAYPVPGRPIAHRQAGLGTGRFSCLFVGDSASNLGDNRFHPKAVTHSAPSALCDSAIILRLFAGGAGLLPLTFYQRRIGSHARGLSPDAKRLACWPSLSRPAPVDPVAAVFRDVSRRLPSVHPEATGTLLCPLMPGTPIKARRRQLVNRENRLQESFG